ncbi:MAG: TadE/TadG family type IV pilus assembly protein [Anaerolineales bacterium]|jgi:Flp pilus assembly protein TadG
MSSSAPKKESGQSLVELAMSLTLLFIILAGIVDIGRAFFTYIMLRDAAQEGALYGSFEEIKCQNVQARIETTSDGVKNLISSGAVNVSCVAKAPLCVDKESNLSGSVTVTVTYADFPITMPFIGALIGGQTVDISASSTDTILTPICLTSIPSP